MTRRAGGVVLLLAALLLAGCGGGGHGHKPKPMSHRAFVRAANHACKLESRTNHRLKEPTTYEMAVRNFQKATVAYETVIVAFRQLTPPRADAAHFSRMLRTLDSADLTVHRYLKAALARNSANVKRLLKRIRLNVKRLNRQSAKLGLRVCTES